MENFKIVKKGVFEKLGAFESRINEFSLSGWKAISISSDNSRVIVLLERQKWYGKETICTSGGQRNDEGDWEVGCGWISIR